MYEYMGNCIIGDCGRSCRCFGRPVFSGKKHAEKAGGTAGADRNSKLPVVKAKVGPQIMTLISEEKIFDSIPVKKEVKAVVSGIYITDVKGIHGKIAPAPPKKKGFFKRALEKAQEKAGAKPLK